MMMYHKNAMVVWEVRRNKGEGEFLILLPICMCGVDKDMRNSYTLNAKYFDNQIKTEHKKVERII